MVITGNNEDDFKVKLVEFISVEVKSLREIRGFTVKDINEIFGISIAHLNLLCNSRGDKVAFKTLFDIAVLLGFAYMYQIQRRKNHIEYKCVFMKEEEEESEE